MSAPLQVAALRRTVLATCVLDDIDVEPMDDGVLLHGPGRIALSWNDIAEAVGEHPTEGPVARHRVATLLRLHQWVAHHERTAGRAVRAAARLLALPVDHALHGGPNWVQHRVLGGALECGIGLVPDGTDGSLATPLPTSVAAAANIDVSLLFEDVRVRAEQLSEVAVRQLHRDRPHPHRQVTSASDRQAVLRPSSGLDIPTLLATTPTRRYLSGADGSGMRAIAVPSRRRGWYDLSRIDPAFVQAAWVATEEFERGFVRSLLVTADEVVLAGGGDGVIDLALADPATERSAFHRSVRFRY